MYDIKERAYFTTLGELRMLLADFQDNTEVCTIGVCGTYLHVDDSKSIISFDEDPLDEDYPELEDDYAYEMNKVREIEEHNKRMQVIAGEEK